MRKRLKNIYSFLKQPNLIFTLFCYTLFIIFSVVAIVFSCLNFSTAILSCIYGAMGITFFYCVYLFIRFDYKKIKSYFKQVKNKLTKKSKLIDRLFNDSYFRTMCATSFSLFLGICFVSYNIFAGLYYNSIWNTSIAIFYTILVAIRVLILINEYKITHSKNQNPSDIQRNRINTFYIEGILLLCVNITLIAPVTLLATSQKQVNLPMWVAIANAGYTFYKVTACIYSFVRSRKNKNLSIIGIKNLNLTSASVSLLSLENTMIITFSEVVESSMQTLIIISAFAVMVLNIWVALDTLIKGKKQKNILKTNNSQLIN